MKKSFNIVGIIFVASIFLCIGYYFMVPYFNELDNTAKQEFAKMARQLKIKGKPKEYIITHFGKPDYIKIDNHREIFVYTPGPIMALWPSECKIGVDMKTGLVDGWQIGSD